MGKPIQRVPVRAAFAFAGAGSLGTFLSGAARECLIAIRAHNDALAEPEVDDDDPRLLNRQWGHIIIDAIGGSSAGALCGSQLVRALYEPEYAGEGQPVDAQGTMSGDWVTLGDFDALIVEGNSPKVSGPVSAPGWTVMSGAKLHEMALRALGASHHQDPERAINVSPLDPSGVVAIGITLTDLLGYHEYAEFECRSVLGHPQFGAVPPSPSSYGGYEGEEIRDLGILKHSEVRKLFVGLKHDSVREVASFLERTDRIGRARAIAWSGAAERLASLATASASLPIALGPLAITDQATNVQERIRRLYTDGGVMNNKPIAPALRLARWQDEVRLLRTLGEGEEAFDPDAVEQALNYQRVCFFVDAFPERHKRRSRSPHPDEALLSALGDWLSEEEVAVREQQIDDALSSPTRGLAALFESMMTSLRAQDIRGIAETNYRIRERDLFISRAIARRAGESNFKLDTLAKAHAYSSVCLHDEGSELTVGQRLFIAEQVWEANRMSGLSGKRRVVMVPVFAPENLVAVLAGEALYALGGLLSRKARLHDAKVGMKVARHVMASLDPDKPGTEVELSEAPEDVLPNDTRSLVARLKVTAEAAVQGDGSGNRFVRGLVSFPLRLNPLARLLQGRLDKRVLGLPVPTGDGGGGPGKNEQVPDPDSDS